jgi:hypothetical protein
VHQPHHEHVRLAAPARDVDEDLEEVDLAEVARLVDERNEHLLALALPLANDLLHDGVADLVALAAQHRVQARSGQLLLPCRPALRILEQLDSARLHGGANRRARHASWLTNASWRASHVAAHRIAIDAHLARDLADGDALDQVSVANDVDLFHSEHPPSGRPASDGGSGGSGWVNFGPPKG